MVLDAKKNEEYNKKIIVIIRNFICLKQNYKKNSLLLVLGTFFGGSCFFSSPQPPLNSTLPSLLSIWLALPLLLNSFNLLLLAKLLFRMLFKYMLLLPFSRDLNNILLMLSSGCMTVSRSGEGGAALLLVFMLPLMLP